MFTMDHFNANCRLYSSCWLDYHSLQLLLQWTDDYHTVSSSSSSRRRYQFEIVASEAYGFSGIALVRKHYMRSRRQSGNWASIKKSKESQDLPDFFSTNFVKIFNKVLWQSMKMNIGRMCIIRWLDTITGLSYSAHAWQGWQAEPVHPAGWIDTQTEGWHGHFSLFTPFPPRRNRRRASRPTRQPPRGPLHHRQQRRIRRRQTPHPLRYCRKESLSICQLPQGPLHHWQQWQTHQRQFLHPLLRCKQQSLVPPLWLGRIASQPTVGIIRWLDTIAGLSHSAHARRGWQAEPVPPAGWIDMQTEGSRVALGRPKQRNICQQMVIWICKLVWIVIWSILNNLMSIYISAKLSWPSVPSTFFLSSIYSWKYQSKSLLSHKSLLVY